jgi:hypothetical protein
LELREDALTKVYIANSLADLIGKASVFTYRSFGGGGAWVCNPRRQRNQQVSTQ